MSKVRVILAITIVLCLTVGTLVIAAQDDYGRSIVVEKREAVKVVTNGTASVIYAGSCILRSVTLRNAYTAGYVYLWDNASAASGTKIMVLGMATDEDGVASTGHNIVCDNGIYATIGNKADITVTYQTF